VPFRPGFGLSSHGLGVEVSASAGSGDRERTAKEAGGVMMPAHFACTLTLLFSGGTGGTGGTAPAGAACSGSTRFSTGGTGGTRPANRRGSGVPGLLRKRVQRAGLLPAHFACTLALLFSEGTEGTKGTATGGAAFSGSLGISAEGTEGTRPTNRRGSGVPGLLRMRVRQAGLLPAHSACTLALLFSEGTEGTKGTATGGAAFSGSLGISAEGTEGTRPANRRGSATRLTEARPAAHPISAVSDASGAGRGNPLSNGAVAPILPVRALFLCPKSVHGGLGEARASVAGSVVPVFHPRSVRRHPAVESSGDGSQPQQRSQP
jgi:hypothetical protein